MRNSFSLNKIYIQDVFVFLESLPYDYKVKKNF